MLSKISDTLLETYLRADTPKPGDAKQPPGFSAVTDILGWVKWLSLAACIAAVMIVAARLAFANRAGSDEPAQIGKVLMAVIVISAAGSLVGFLATA